MKTNLRTLLLICHFVMLKSIAQPTTTPWLRDYLLKQPGSALSTLINDPAKYRLQVLYIQIDREAGNKPKLTPQYFHYDPSLYFNPASTVKMPLAYLALDKLNQMNQPGIDLYTPVEFLKSRPWQTELLTDSTARNGKPSIAHFIKKAFLVSDNDAYNRLYQFVGQRPVHDRLWELGYKDAVIPRQFLGLSPDKGRYTNALRFVDSTGRLLWEQPEGFNPTAIPHGEPVLIGQAHMNQNEELVKAPFDFTLHNRLSLGDLANMLLSVMVPEAFTQKQQFNFKPSDYQFLRYWHSAYPSETDEPKYDTVKYYDSYVKFFFRDSTHRMPAGVRVFNKVGWAYGFLTDVSYVVDFEKGIEYLLAATVYVNSDGVVNDSEYDYENLGWPFLNQLGQAIYRYEQQRPKAQKPNLDYLKLEYGKRNPLDKQPVIEEVDN